MIVPFDFSDLYLNKDQSYFSEVQGKPDPYPAPDELRDELDTLFDNCIKHNIPDSGKTIEWNGRRFRTSPLKGLNGITFVLRKMAKKVPDIQRLRLHEHPVNKVMTPDIKGLIVIAGEYSSGKTTTASSIISARLSKYGGVAVTIEDPPEMPLEGRHGHGICYQTTVNEQKGETFAYMTKMAARWAPDIIFLGEIRDSGGAMEAIKAAINGSLVVVTIHSNNVISAIERMYTYAAKESAGSNTEDITSLLALGLYGVIHQKKIGSRIKNEFLFFDKDSEGAAQLVKERKFNHLKSEISLQLNRYISGYYNNKEG
jgi:twitching motility protein PilT